MDATPSRVFITGALGFIGRRLAEHYRARGVQVSGVDLRGDPALDVTAGDITAPRPLAFRIELTSTLHSRELNRDLREEAGRGACLNALDD